MDEAFGWRRQIGPFGNQVADCLYSHGGPDSPHLNWSLIQYLLETAVPHVLIILDCCFAATAARDITEGTSKEILAACGRESPTHGVGQRSFTSALTDEMLAFNCVPFTAVMLLSRLVTMRWRLAFTPIYALLSERGGNSATICPLPHREPSARLEANFAELEATVHPQDGQASIAMEDSSSSSTPLEQTVDTRVLLSVSVVEDAILDVSDWTSWLTTAAPWDVTKVDVQVHSVFRSYSTLVVVSVPTSAWSRLPERAAYRFIGFIRSGDIFQATKRSIKSLTEDVSSRGELPQAGQNVTSYAPNWRKGLPSSFPSLKATQPQSPSPKTTPFGIDEMKTPIGNTAQLLSSIYETGTGLYPSNWQSDHQSDPHAQLIHRGHKRRKMDSVAQSRVNSHADKLTWSSEEDELLVRARQQGLDWQLIASQHFPDQSANACRKRHERLMEWRNNPNNSTSVKMETVTAVYVDVREQMWRLLADRVGEKWQNVEAMVCHPNSN